ncbi:MAG: MSHA biogenesis protein MshG [Gammaproteobacteria bacterium RIFCSPLOWO2_02_FULL_61_13]|nr:MAG: MSHA biogenesis protein MshG [Gammaproteobacteria bacterium RIFCSPLOWO2_02_FULL_61_13]
MPSFTYKGRSRRGALVEGVLDAGSADSVAAQLINNGITPIDITVRSEAAATMDVLQNLRSNKAPDLQDLILFTRQMYTLSKAGVPIVRAINGLIQSTRNLPLVQALRDVLANLESGRDLASALSMHSKIFSNLAVSMVRVGENTGRLEEAFLRLTEYLEREKDTRERIKTALRYPIFVLVAIGVALGIVNIFVIPTFAQLFAKASVALPWQTRVLIATSDFFVAWWWLMLGLLGAGAAAFTSYIQTEPGKYWWGRQKVNLPLVGDIIKRATLSRFARAFAMALTSGVPLIQALSVVSRAVDNEFIGEHILNMRNGVERGESLTRTAALTGMFTPLVLQMLAVGEETGAVDDMMNEVAEYYEREVDYDVKNLSALIEPIMIVAMGVLVLILALGIFLPMWDISKAMR